jgi:tetratricopeptide (TPR) repeat protein
VAAYFFVKPRIGITEASAGVRQLAILPFRNLTTTAEGDLWGVALADTVGARLSDVNGLQVVTPRATIEASDTTSNLESVARKLGANTLLAGTLQKENDRFRITYRLLDANGRQIAADAIDGPALFALQDRVADSVVKDLRLRRRAQRTPTPSGLDTPAEQERYLEAVGLIQRYDRRQSIERAIQILGKLAEERPNSALVQAAYARASLAMYTLTKDKSWADKAIAATDAARGLDPELPEVDITTGETLLLTGRAKEAVVVFRRALAARPGDVVALRGLGRASEAVGDTAAAEAALRRATELEPSFAAISQLAILYFDLGRYGEAADTFRRAGRAAPDSYAAWSNAGAAETMRCNYPAALEAYRKALALDPKRPEAAANQGMTELWTGHTAEAVATLERAAQNSPKSFATWGNLGDAYRWAQAPAGKSEAAYEQSIALAREQLRVNPDDADALAFLATGLARTGHADAAAEPMQHALAAAAEKDPAAFADAAIVAALAGRDKDALAMLRKAVSAGYCPEILTRQPEFARLRDNPDFRSIVASPQKAAGS